MKLHHIAFACKDIAAAVAEMRNLCYLHDESGYVIDESQDHALLKLCKVDGMRIEFVDGKISHGFANGNNLYHLCFESDDYTNELQKISDLGWIAVSESKRAALFNNKRVSFWKKSGYPMIEVKEA